jgi:hypothetical protein
MQRMAQTSTSRVRRRRENLRRQGMRPLQIWIPDTRSPGFAEEARRQGALVAAALADDGDLNWWLDRAEKDFFDAER